MSDLIERIEYCLQHSEDEEKLQQIFQTTEWDVLEAMKAYKLRLQQIERQSQQEEWDKMHPMEKRLEERDAEKEEILYLKEKTLMQLDILLKTGTVEAWCEISVWYRFVIQERLAARFWEFYILKIALDIFIEECNREKFISVLQLHSMKEINEAYFKTVFLLRRIEYEIGSVDELTDFMREHNLSLTFLTVVLKEAQIYDKNKVKQKIESRWKSDIK